MALSNDGWSSKFNNECASKHKQFGQCEWYPCDFNYDPEYNSRDDFRDYCYNSYNSFSLCESCEQNSSDFLNIREGTVLVQKSIDHILEHIEHIGQFLKQQFPNYCNFVATSSNSNDP